MSIRSELQKGWQKLRSAFTNSGPTQTDLASATLDQMSKPQDEVEITERALKIRHFKQEVYEQLAATTILAKLPEFLRETRIAIDVGGNVGHIAYFLSQHAETVYSFEAVGTVYERLREVRNLAPNIVTENCAIADFCGEADLFVDHNRLSNSGLHNVGDVDVSFKPRTEFKSTKTRVKSIDSLGLSGVGFIKIDVEGSELDVLRGAQETVSTDRPDLLVEIFEPFCKYPAAEIFEFLEQFGYQCYHYNSETQNLMHCANLEQSLRAVAELHHLHDGDFLFSCKPIPQMQAA